MYYRTLTGREFCLPMKSIKLSSTAALDHQRRLSLCCFLWCNSINLLWLLLNNFEGNFWYEDYYKSTIVFLTSNIIESIYRSPDGFILEYPNTWKKL